MASPTEAEVITQLKNAIKPFEELRKFCESNSPNWLGLEDTLQQSLESDYASEIAAQVDAARAGLNGVLSQAPQVVSPILRTWAQILASPDLAPDATDQAILDRIYDRMITSGDRIASRVVTFGTPSAGGGNVGNGSIKRLTKDERNFDLEAIYLESKVAKCIRDSGSGTNKGKEVFQFRGKKANRDLLALSGSGGVLDIPAKNAEDSILQSPSFESYDVAAAPTVISGWASLAGALSTNYEIDTTNYYRGYGNDDSNTHQSLKIKANDTIYQLARDFRQQLSPGIPMYAQLAYNRLSTGADGTLEFHVGAISATKDLSTAGATGWEILSLAIGQNSWYKNLKENDLDIKIKLSGGATFGVRVDDVIVTPFTFFDGTWYCPMGAATPFLRDDVFTWSDSATDSVIQRWLWRMFGRYLPHSTGGGITIADP